jgi:pimeloyl-[acyl-carrier protein] methyl ester esterase
MRMRIRLFLIIGTLAVILFGTRGSQAPPPLSVSTFGHGPSIVLVHGLGSRAEQWLPVARLLARRYRVSMVDLPGHGPTAMPEPFSLDRAALGLDLALNESPNEPVVLVGHSLGGLVATAEALENPGRVRGLVLVETALRPQVDAAQRPALFDELDRDYTGLVHSAYLSFGRDSTQGERLWSDVRRLDPAMVKQWIRLAWTTDLSARVARLDIPVLAILAERSWPKDEPWTTTATALGYSAIPRIEPVRLEGCGHFVMLDRPEDLARLIDRFATTLDGGPIASRR